MWWLIALWLLQPAVVTPGTPAAVTLTAGFGPVDLIYPAAGNEILTVTAASHAVEAIDVTLEILINEERLAFNDDHIESLADLAPHDAAVTHLTLPAAGDYTLRIHSFNGAQSGEVEILVQSRPLVEACQPVSQLVELLPHTAFDCRIDLQAGQRVTLTARDSGGTLDPVLRLLNLEGRPVARNDDHSAIDLTLNVLDAQITAYAVPEAGEYTVQVSDFAGAAGSLELRIEIES